MTKLGRLLFYYRRLRNRFRNCPHVYTEVLNILCK
jgi:hypothetical protein